MGMLVLFLAFIVNGLILAVSAQTGLAQGPSLDDAVAQNSGIDSGLRGYGVPPSYDWSDNGWPARGIYPSPPGFTAITGWGHVYPEAGMPNVPCKIYLKGLQTYVHKISGGWSLVQDQVTNPSALGQFSADVRVGSPATNTRLADSTEIMDSPGNGYMVHWWPGTRGAYPAGTVDGAFVLFVLKTDTANCHLVASAGIDYWRDASAPFLADFSNNPGAAVSSWVKLSTTYKYFYATNFTSAQLMADPPPLTGSPASGPAGVDAGASQPRRTVDESGQSVASETFAQPCETVRLAAADVLAAKTAALWCETPTASGTCLTFRSRELRDGSGRLIARPRLVRDYLQSQRGLDPLKGGFWRSHPDLHFEGTLLLRRVPIGCRATLCVSVLSREVMWWAFVPVDSERSSKFDANSRLAFEYLEAIKAAHVRDRRHAERFLSNPREPHRRNREFAPSGTCAEPSSRQKTTR